MKLFRKWKKEQELNDERFDLLINLVFKQARRITELEKDIAILKDESEMLIDDVSMLDERTQPIVSFEKAVKESVDNDN